MTKTNLSRLNMYNAVIAYCNSNSTTVATVPSFQTALTALVTIVNQIHDTLQMQDNVITGITTDKRAMRAALCKQASNLGGVITAFATTTNNNELKEQVNFPVSELNRLKDEVLIARCSNIYDALNANVSALANSGVTAATVTAFETAIDAYNAKIATPRNAVSLRSAHAKSLTELFREANGILKMQMDKLAIQFIPTAGSFYTAYKNNRAIVGPGAPVVQAK
jgi:hypothetical protein